MIGVNPDLCIKHLKSLKKKKLVSSGLLFFKLLNFKAIMFPLVNFMYAHFSGGMTLFTPYWHSSHSLFLPSSHLVRHFSLSLSPTKFRGNSSNFQKPHTQKQSTLDLHRFFGTIYSRVNRYLVRLYAAAAAIETRF